MLHNPSIEPLAIAKLRSFQNERLHKLLKKVYTNVPFYKKTYDEHGVDLNQIKTVHNLHKLPSTKKEDLQDNYPFDLFAAPMDKVHRIQASSGTTGKPTVVGYTKNELAIFDEVVARSLVCANARTGMKLHNAYRYVLFTGGLGMHGGATKSGMAVIPVSGGMTYRQFMILQDFAPAVICCTPSYTHWYQHAD